MVAAYEAFKAYAATHKVCLLVDTYDTNTSVYRCYSGGAWAGDQMCFMGLRIDSGILPTFPRKVRQQLDEAGYEAKIYALNDLDEGFHSQPQDAKARLMSGVAGTKLITIWSIALGIYRVF